MDMSFLMVFVAVPYMANNFLLANGQGFKTGE